jgi:effector-binding domain-containing protein
MDTEQNGSDTRLEQLEPQSILSIRGTIRVEQLGETVGDRLQALGSYLQQTGAQAAGPPFVRYFTFEEVETDFEMGVPVVKPVAGEGRIASGELPGGPAITTWHMGPHNKLGEAYARIEEWRQEHGREPAGPAREVYHWIDLSQPQDPSTLDPSTRGTQLIQPVK